MKINADLLYQFLDRIVASNPELKEELREIRRKPEYLQEAEKLHPLLEPVNPDGLETADANISLETIVLRVGRPVLTISAGKPLLEINEVESQFWRSRLENSADLLQKAIPSVGRIELENHPGFEWVGTGWMVAENMVVTNRHVAEVFSRSQGNDFVFRQITSKPIKPGIDFLKELGNPASFTFSITRTLYIEPEGGPDLAFLEIYPVNGNRLPTPLPLGKGSLIDSQVVVVGYPASDSRIPDVALMEKIFGNVYNVKRLAPGNITAIEKGHLLHDCSTLGGCSGGLVLNLDSGEAAGLHFAGRFLEANYAVPAEIVADRMIIANRERPVRVAVPNSFGTKTSSHLPVDVQMQTFTINLPLQITVPVEQPVYSAAPAQDLFYTEGVPADYSDRVGYVPVFLGDEFDVPLPEINTDVLTEDILFYDNSGKRDHVLRYEHFSVVMSKARRLCFFSAVNIDGSKSRSATRVGWRLDPRISAGAQILNECYGSAPKFSRGHMTRREDPVWGDETTALRGNADSMCVTNTVPQMQTFNAPIWLGLEDYALKNARRDKMKISVFTGPIFEKGDPWLYGVQIPLATWKIIVFIHDITGELTATGYKLSQQQQMPQTEFVYSAYQTAQVSIASIAEETGVSFGSLVAADPLYEQPEIINGELIDFDQIRFI